MHYQLKYDVVNKEYLSDGSKLLYSILCLEAGNQEDTEFITSNRRLAKISCCSERTVARRLKELESHKMISIKDEHHNRVMTITYKKDWEYEPLV